MFTNTQTERLQREGELLSLSGVEEAWGWRGWQAG